MHRRRLLAVLGAGPALLAGCIARDDPPGGSYGTATTRPDTTGDAQTTDLRTDGGRSLSVSRVETFTHALRLNDLGESPRGSIPAVADLDDRQREVVAAAIAGGYETDDPLDWLVEFLSGTPFVRREGQFYRVRHTLPTYTVTAEPTTEDEVSGEIASNEAYREAVTHDGVVTTGLLRLARRGGYDLVDPWPALRSFLDRYDAVRYRGELLSVSMAVDDPGPPYAVTAERASLDEVAGRSVWDADSASPAVRDVLRAAGRTEGLYPLDAPPAGLLENLDAHDLVYLDGRFYTTYVEKRDALPVSLTATVPDPSLDDGGARLRLLLRNEADREVRIAAGAPRPFGILYYHPVGDPDDRSLLWTDAYEESDHVHVEDGSISMVQDIALLTPVASGDEVSRTFTVRETDLEPGEYVVEGDVGVEVRDGEDGDDGGTFPYRVVFEVA